MRIPYLACLALAFFLGAPSTVRATLVDPMDMPALVAQADRIALARVETLRPRWTAEGTAIVTEVTLRVERALKGPVATGEVVTLLREGGVVGTTGMRVSGAASFRVGEEVVVFVEKRGAASWTVGMAMGKMRVETAGAQRVVVRDLSGLGFLRPPRPEAAVRPLDEVLHEIATLCRAAGARP